MLPRHCQGLRPPSRWLGGVRRLAWRRAVCFHLVALLAALVVSCGKKPVLRIGSPSSPLAYTNIDVPEVPWSIHIVRVQLSNSVYQVDSMHAGGGVLGLSTLPAQIKRIPPALGTPVAAINGDFYERFKAFAGEPRGLQIIDGELLTAPGGEVNFWVDPQGRCHATNVVSHFRVTWPGGTSSAFGLNEERPTNGLVLYTPAMGHSTHASGGRELVLEAEPKHPWLPLRIGHSYKARVREIRDTGDTPLGPDIMVLSIGPALEPRLPKLEVGQTLELSTATAPDLAGARTAISGAPMLVRGGRRLKIPPSSSEDYEYTSRLERHPRSAIGWNGSSLFLVVVDGRQRDLSVGMTLEELSSWLLKLGCDEAMNFDGGGSATLWYEGEVRNSPCDHYLRGIANSLIIVRRQNH